MTNQQSTGINKSETENTIDERSEGCFQEEHKKKKGVRVRWETKLKHRTISIRITAAEHQVPAEKTSEPDLPGIAIVKARIGERIWKINRSTGVPLF